MQPKSLIRLLLLWFTSLLAACGSSFRTSDQSGGYFAINNQMDRIQNQATANPAGLFVVFDTNGGKATVSYLTSSETEEAGMRDLIQRAQDPCASDGPNPRIVAFAPPLDVDLPRFIVRCNILRDRVRRDLAFSGAIARIDLVLKRQSALNSHDSRVLEKLVRAVYANKSDIDHVASSVSKIEKVQTDSWAHAISTLEDIKTKVQRVNGVN